MSIFDTKPDSLDKKNGNVFSTSEDYNKIQSSDRTVVTTYKPREDSFEELSKQKAFDEFNGKFLDELNSLKEMSTGFQVVSGESFKQATEMVLQANAIYKAIDNCRKKLVRPYIDIKRSIDDYAKNFTSPCEEILIDLKAKRNKFERSIRDAELKRQREEDERIRLENEKIRKEQERIRIENEKALKAGKQQEVPPTLIEKTELNPALKLAPKPIVRYNDGTVQYKKVWKFEVANLEEVPRKFLSINESEIKASIGVGVRDIPGLRIYEETKEIFRSKR